jgi:WD40 repeat protein
VETGEIVSEWIEEDAKFESPTFSPDGSTIAVGMGYRKPGNLGQAEVRLLDVESGAEKQRLVAPGNMDWPAVLAFSPDGKLLVGGTMHGLVIVWDVATGKVKSTVRAHKGFIGSITFSPDGSTLLTSATDALVKLWNASKLLKMKDARESLTLVPLDKGSEWLAYTPEGYYDCSPGAEKYVMWRLGKELFPAEKFAKEYHRPDLVKKRFG